MAEILTVRVRGSEPALVKSFPSRPAHSCFVFQDDEEVADRNLACLQEIVQWLKNNTSMPLTEPLVAELLKKHRVPDLL
jgi:hypothetical protein